MEEIWKDIPGHEGTYQVSNYGQVKSLDYYVTEKTGKIRFRKGRLMTNKLPKGANYYQIHLFKNRDCKLWRIHKLVALTFIPNPTNLPEINHIDRNKLNNFVGNLEWCNKSDNMLHAHRVANDGNGERAYHAKLKDSDIPNIRNLLSNGNSVKSVAAQYDVCLQTIRRIGWGKSWKLAK